MKSAGQVRRTSQEFEARSRMSTGDVEPRSQHHLDMQARRGGSCVGERLRGHCAELARRRTAGLTARQEEHLSRWGYPYVLDCFRFHVTLTDRLEAREAEQLLPSLSAYFAPVIGKPITIDEITLFVQPAEDAAFDECRRFRLRGSQPG